MNGILLGCATTTETNCKKVDTFIKGASLISNNTVTKLNKDVNLRQ